jgi:tetratricopeptide (TPR) repeat protein
LKFGYVRYISSFAIILAGSFFFNSSAFSRESAGQRSFLSACEYYDKGEYQKAIQNFTDIIHMGLHSPEVYFNLGNSYYLSGDTARAILNFERARLLSPGDADIIRNAEAAYSGTRHRDTRRKMVLLMPSAVQRVLDRMPIHLVVIYCNFLCWSFVLAFIRALKLSKGKKILLAPVAAILFFFVIINVAYAYNRITYENSSAVVMVDIIDARLKPFVDSDIVFPATMGMKVRIVSQTSQWYKIERPDRKGGWVPRVVVERLRL